MRRAAIATIAVLVAVRPALAQPVPACPGDQVVCVNTRTGVEHAFGMRWFRRTLEWKTMCRKAADAQGFHMTRNGQ